MASDNDWPDLAPPAPQYKSEFLKFVAPLVAALKDKGGQAQPKEAYAAVAARLNLGDEAKEETLDSGTVKFENQIAWARSYLVQSGYIDGSIRGIWKLTPKGKSARLTGQDVDKIYSAVQKLKNLKKKPEKQTEAEWVQGGDLPQGPEKEEEETDLAPSASTSIFSDHRPVLQNLIQSLSAEGFEKFCAVLLSMSGVEEVTTTSFSKDKGIDGMGRLKMNDFVYVKVAYQAKHFAGSGEKVGSKLLREFRGSMGKDYEKGIFFTTTTFTDSAKEEARKIGNEEIELVDMVRMIEICENNYVGLSEQKILVPDTEFFEGFSVP